MDLLAKSAITHGTPYNGLLPYTDLYTSLKVELLRNSYNSLKAAADFKGKKYFQFFKGFTLKTWIYKVQDLNRESITTFCRLRSDHYGLNASLHRCNLVARPNCPCGALYQDIEHILWQCPNYDDKRSAFINKLIKLRISVPFEAHKLISKPVSGIIIAVHSYLKSCDFKV